MKNVVILGQGKNWISIINFLDRNAVQKVDVWSWGNKRISTKIKGDVDLGLIFFEYPDQTMQENIQQLHDMNAEYILMWPFESYNSNRLDFLHLKNFFLPQRPIWNSVLNKL